MSAMYLLLVLCYSTWCIRRGNVGSLCEGGFVTATVFNRSYSCYFGVHCFTNIYKDGGVFIVQKFIRTENVESGGTRVVGEVEGWGGRWAGGGGGAACHFVAAADE